MKNAIVTAAAKNVTASDKTAAKYGVSRVQRLQDRAAALDLLPETRGAVYPLAWLIDTGRLSSEREASLLALSPRAFAAVALRIAEAGGSVNASAEAWMAAA